MAPRTMGPEADPTEILPFPVGQTPPDDRAYFEMLTWFVFGAGLNWKVMRAKWPNFQKAFRRFNLNAVARFTEADVLDFTEHARTRGRHDRHKVRPVRRIVVRREPDRTAFGRRSR